MTRNAAFTLIEMMIALALSATIMLTAGAAFRLTSQTMTQANRLATENGLITAGYLAALDEMDSWRAYDDPDDTTRLGMRTSGMPFSPFSASFSRSGSSSFSGADSDRGWDSSYAWPSSDPRTWWNGNQAEWCRTNNDMRMGTYNLFGCTTGSGPTHTWLYNQMQGLKGALGYQGLCEYMPANTLYAYYTPVSVGTGITQTDPGGLCNELSRGGWFNYADGGTTFPLGIFRLTKDYSFAIPPLPPLGNGNPVLGNYKRYWNTAQGSQQSVMSGFISLNLAKIFLLAGNPGPASWPHVQIGVAHYLSYNRYCCLCKVAWADPLTGQSRDLTFSGFGTTLRGARQQRRPATGATGAPGWAVWHYADAASNDRTLDSY